MTASPGRLIILPLDPSQRAAVLARGRARRRRQAQDIRREGEEDGLRFAIELLRTRPYDEALADLLDLLDERPPAGGDAA